MLAPVPSARLLRVLKASIDEKKLCCSFCRPRRSRHVLHSTYSTRITPVTSVNAQKTVPDEYQALYHSLQEFGKKASVYVNVSQLQLALKNLEIKDSVVRVAVLGVNGQQTARQLVKVLLSDPLSPEAAWEKELDGIQQDGKPLLIRAGLKTAVESSHPLLRTLTIPSATLQDHKVEFLISQVDYDGRSSGDLTEAGLATLLSPSLHAQQSFSGRTTAVTYPVHRTIIIDDGFKSVLGLANLLQSEEGKIASGMISIASNVDWSTIPNSQYGTTFVDIAKGQHAIDTFRDSLKNSLTYEHEWLSSGLPALKSSLLSAPDSLALVKTEVRDLINHVLDETELAVKGSETEATQEDNALIVPETVRAQLQEATTQWAEDAHKEFQLDLQTIVQSKQWRKLSWWKLLWRVDEVESITSDTIRRAYLVESEKNALFLVGRIAQAGLFDEITESSLLKSSEEIKNNSAPSYARRTVIRYWRDITKMKFKASALVPTERHQPAFISRISNSRFSILNERNPPFARLAQGYLLSALSLTGLSSLTSVLAYMTVSTTSIYEAGTIAAVGLVASAFRLQKRWEAAREDWFSAVQLEGKRALSAMEEECRSAVENGGRRIADDIGREEREDIKRIISDSRTALAELDEGISESESIR